MNTNIDEIVASDAGTGATDVNTEGLTSIPDMEITSNSD